MELAQEKAAELLANLPWGTHSCNFYKAKADLVDILAVYFKSGLLNNEFCLWITSEDFSAEDAKRVMRRVLPNFDFYPASGQIEIRSYDEWYLKDGVFDPERVLAMWIGKYNEAVARGYDGMLLSGNAFRLEPASWKKFVDYEEELDQAIAKRRIKALCTYSLDLCQAYDVIDVVKHHGYALIKRGEWELIENAQRKRAEKRALEKAMAELEKMVESRTAELQRANGNLQAEVAERNRAEEELRLSQKELRDLAAYLQTVREEERTRIARELHDEIGQALTGIRLYLEKSAGERVDNTAAGGSPVTALVNDLIGRVRDLSLELRPAMLDDLGLLAALAWHFDRYDSQMGIHVTFKHTGLEGQRFDPELETAAYRIVQEALTNAARHARIDNVDVDIRVNQGALHICIRDCGVGFNPDSRSNRITGGLSGMRERAVMLGGRLKIESASGAGTVLTAELPLAKS